MQIPSWAMFYITSYVACDCAPAIQGLLFGLPSRSLSFAIREVDMKAKGVYDHVMQDAPSRFILQRNDLSFVATECIAVVLRMSGE